MRHFNQLQVVAVKLTAVVKNREQQSALTELFFRAVNADFLNRVVCISQTRGIAESENNVADENSILDNISRRAGDIRDYAFLRSREQVHQRAFTDVRSAGDNGVYSLLDRLTRVICIEKSFEGKLRPFAGDENILIADLGDVLLGVVRPRGKVCC